MMGLVIKILNFILIVSVASCTVHKKEILHSPNKFSFQELVENFHIEVNEILIPRFKKFRKTDRIVYFAYANFLGEDSDCSEVKGMTETELKKAIHFTVNGAYSKILNEKNDFKGIISQTLISSTPKNYKTYDKELHQIKIYLKEGADLMLVLSNCNNNNILNTPIIYKKAEDSLVFYL